MFYKNLDPEFAEVPAEVDTDGKEVLTEMSETAVHELLHSVRLDHPFERIQTNDTFLFNDGLID